MDMPRRFGVRRPNDLMVENYKKAMKAQGFTPEAFTPKVLTTQRLWNDSANPNYGEGK